MNRIKCLSNFITPCNCIYDVGSDHAFLAVLLLKNEIVKRAINIEINPNPLKLGINNLKANNCYKQTENIINDGLNNILNKTKYKPNFICIAGMGGKSIIKILENKDKRLKNCKYILQANCEFSNLRKWLAKNSWDILKEQTLIDRNKFYQIILAKPNGKRHVYNEFDAYFGKKQYQIDKDAWLKHINFTNNKIKTKKLNKFNAYFKKLYSQILEKNYD